MSWQTLDPVIRETAERVCTEKELTALKLWHNGAGYRRIGLILGISMSTARGRIHRAIDRISNTLEQETHATRDAQHSTDPLRKPDRPTTPRP